MAIYINTTELTGKIITKDTNNDGFQHAGSISSISISNNDDTNDAVLSLRLVDSENNDTYIVNSVTVPIGVILLLDHDIAFNVNNYDLYFDNDSVTPDVTIIIK